MSMLITEIIGAEVAIIADYRSMGAVACSVTRINRAFVAIIAKRGMLAMYVALIVIVIAKVSSAEVAIIAG